MSKLSKILYCLLFGALSLIGFLIIIHSFTSFHLKADGLIRFQAPINIICGAFIFGYSFIRMLNIIKGRTDKIVIHIYRAMTYLGIYLALSNITYALEGASPNSTGMIFFIILGLLTIAASIIAEKIKIKGEKIKPIVALSVTGGIGAITSFIFLVYFSFRLGKFVALMILIVCLYVIGLPFIFKYLLNEPIAIKASKTENIPSLSDAQTTITKTESLSSVRVVPGIYLLPSDSRSKSNEFLNRRRRMGHK